MPKKRNIYAMNRQDPNAIVYLDSDGSTIRLTREDFSTEEEFQKWKAWSDQQYLQESRREKNYWARKVTIKEFDQRQGTPADSETLLLEHEDRMAQKRAAQIVTKDIQKLLTKNQYRRLWLYGVMHMTEEEIGRLENVSHQAVSKSLRSAMRRIRKYIRR